MKRSLEERLAPFLPEQGSGDLAKETLECVFQGVSRLTNMGHPLRRLRQIKDAYQMPDDFLYVNALRLAERNISSGEWRREGEELMCQLFIEPFTAIHQIQKEDNWNDRT